MGNDRDINIVYIAYYVYVYGPNTYRILCVGLTIVFDIVP